jgi:hypothetical protein
MYIVSVQDLVSALALPEGVSRTAALVAWVQSLFAPGSEPVLVGGAAVELYTGGAYTTGDLDFVGTVPPAVENVLTRSGFRKQGRHWLQETVQLYLEFPSSSLHEGERAVRRASEGHSILVVSPEDLIAERLAAWCHWRSSVDGVNAWLVFKATRASLDLRRLRRQARLRDADGALRALHRLSRLASRRVVLTEEVERWALLGP